MEYEFLSAPLFVGNGNSTAAFGCMLIRTDISPLTFQIDTDTSLSLAYIHIFLQLFFLRNKVEVLLYTASRSIFD